MPHVDSVLVLHPNGTFFAQRAKVAHLAENPNRAYWRDLAQTELVIVGSHDDTRDPNYEYGGRKSWDPQAPTPWEAGGQTVLQLSPLKDKRHRGFHLSMPDRLWRPPRKKKESPKAQ